MSGSTGTVASSPPLPDTKDLSTKAATPTSIDSSYSQFSFSKETYNKSTTENIYCHNKIIANIIKLTHKYHPYPPFFHTTAGTLPGEPEKSLKGTWNGLPVPGFSTGVIPHALYGQNIESYMKHESCRVVVPGLTCQTSLRRAKIPTDTLQKLVDSFSKRVELLYLQRGI